MEDDSQRSKEAEFNAERAWSHVDRTLPILLDS